MKINPSIQLAILIGILFTLVFIKLGQHPIHPWDEARRGITAIEMMQNGDWVNIHYRGQPDEWAAKPPLVVWGIAASFSIFGFNEFALRLPSALAILFAFFMIFKIIRLYKPFDFAFYTCLILLSVNGLIGWHVGRSGDTDASLLCFLMIGLYYFLLFFDFQREKSIYLAGLFWGIAFMVKGPAIAVLFPGLLIYVVLNRRFKEIFQSKKVWMTGLICLAFPIGWFLIIQKYGIVFDNNPSGDNVYERLFLYDLLERFTENEKGWKKAFSFDFFFYSLDKLFNLWSYFFFIFLATGLYLLIDNWKKWSNYLLASEQKLLLLSLCLYFPLAFFLTLAAKSHSWYLVPVVPLVGIITYFGINIFRKKNTFVFPVFIFLLCFTIGRQFYRFYTPKEKPAIITNNWKTLKNAENIAVIGIIEQDILLYNYFANRAIYYPQSNTELKNNTILFMSQSPHPEFDFTSFSLVEKGEKYRILQRNK